MNKNLLLNMVGNYLKNDVSINDILTELDNYICLLTRENADIIEKCIANDPNYPDIMSPIIKKVNLFQNNSSIKTIYNSLGRVELEDFVWKVAIANSIQGKNLSVKTYMADYMLNKENQFFERLQVGELKLVEDLECFVYQSGNNVRHECSWCSKVCKFLHDYLFNNDAYYIYDNNVRNRLNDYRSYYELPQTSMSILDVNNKEWYQNLCRSLDELKNKLKDKLNRSEIDHILWGFAKYKVVLARKK